VEQVQFDKMASCRDCVLAAEAKKAGSASEDTRLIILFYFILFYF